jgi:hypothetical protein
VKHTANKFATRFMQSSSLVSSSTLQMEAIISSEMSVHVQPTTRHYIPEDKTFQLQNVIILIMFRHKYVETVARLIIITFLLTYCHQEEYIKKNCFDGSVAQKETKLSVC